MIVDCHMHVARTMTGFWQPLRYGKALDQGVVRQLLPPSFDPTSSPPEVLLGYLDDAGVDRAFLVQHHMFGDQNETVLECLKSWPDRFATGGRAGLAQSDRRVPERPGRQLPPGRDLPRGLVGTRALEQTSPGLAGPGGGSVDGRAR